MFFMSILLSRYYLKQISEIFQKLFKFAEAYSEPELFEKIVDGLNC